jgi:hypothetical protein
MLKILIAMLFLITSCLFAQKESFNTIIKVHPLAAINPDRPSITGSIELLLNEKVGIEVGYGRRHSNSFWFKLDKIDTMTVDFSGNTVLFEVTLYDPFKEKFDTKYNWFFPNREAGNYVGVAYRYIDDLYNTSKYYFDHKDTGVTPATNDCYAVQRKVRVLVLKAGYVNKFQSFTTEFYYEAGIRYKNRVHIKSEFDPENDTFPSGLYPWERAYKGILPTLNIGFKVNYQIF